MFPPLFRWILFPVNSDSCIRTDHGTVHAGDAVILLFEISIMETMTVGI
jgi:hypothetical protein